MKSKTEKVEVDVADYYRVWKQDIAEALERPVVLRLKHFKAELEKAKGKALSAGDMMIENRDGAFWVDEHRGPYRDLIGYIVEELDCDFYDAIIWVVRFLRDNPYPVPFR